MIRWLEENPIVTLNAEEFVSGLANADIAECRSALKKSNLLRSRHGTLSAFKGNTDLTPGFVWIRMPIEGIARSEFCHVVKF